MRIYIFGDSIAQGYFDSRGGWANRITIYYQLEALKNLSSEWVEVFNLGISGDTTEGVLRRLRPEVEARRLSEAEECIVLAVGINDAILRDNRVLMEVYDFQNAYDALIDEALKLCPRVICVGLTAVNETQTDPWIYSTSGKQWKNNHINLFEDTIKQSAELKEVAFVPLHDGFMRKAARKPMLADGLHPNANGHAFIAKEILAAAEALR